MNQKIITTNKQKLTDIKQSDHHLFNRMLSHGNAICIYDQGMGYTFNYVVSLSKTLASYFQSIGIGYQSKVFIHLENRLETVVTYLACWINGSVACPLNYRLKPYEIKLVDQVVMPDLFITDEHKSQVIKPILKSLPIKTVESVFLELEQLTIPTRLKNITNYPYKASDIACIHFTSGSTGFYKAVAHNYQQINHYAFDRAIDMDYTDNDRLLICLPLMHAFSFSYQLLPAFALGIPCILVAKFDEAEIVKQINQFKVTSTSFLPAQCYYLSLFLEKTGKKITSLNDCLSAGDLLPTAISRHFAKYCNGVIPRQGLGMTECFGYSINRKNNNRYHTSGQALIGVNIHLDAINDIDDLRQENTVTGEIYIQSTGNMLGYYSDDKGIYDKPCSLGVKSGDLASIDPDGFIHFKGRIRHLIIRDGSNIMPLEIENILYLHPDILESAVGGLKHPIHGQIIYALIVTNNKNLTKDDITTFVKYYLADYKAPEVVQFVTSLPKNATGKIDRDRLHSLIEKEIVLQNEILDVEI